MKSYPGGRELASTKSPASFSISSVAACSGVRGRAMRPVRADSRIPKGDISFMKAFIRGGFAELYRSYISGLPFMSGTRSRDYSHFHDAVISTYIQHFPPKLMRQMRNSFQMLMLMPQSLTSS